MVVDDVKKIRKKEHKKEHKEFQVCLYIWDGNTKCVRWLMRKPFSFSAMWILIVDENVNLIAQEKKQTVDCSNHCADIVNLIEVIATEMMTETKDKPIFIISDRVLEIDFFFDAHAFAQYHSTVFIVQSNRTKPNDTQILTSVFFFFFSFSMYSKFKPTISSAELGIQSQIKFDNGTITFFVLNPFMLILLLLVD